MLGLQCQPAAAVAASQQQVAVGVAAARNQEQAGGLMRPPSGGPASSTSGASSTAGSPAPDDQEASLAAARRERVSSSSSSSSNSSAGARLSPASPNLILQAAVRRSPPPPSLASHLKLINARPQHQHQHPLQLTGAKRPASPQMEPAGRPSSIGSPGYHSAAPSPSSSAASPVSSSSGASEPELAPCLASGFNSFCSTTVTSPVAAFLPTTISQQQHQQTQQTHQQRQQQVAIPSGPPPGVGARPAGPLRADHQLPHLLDYFPAAQQDGLNLSWFHGANSGPTLSAALVSDRMLVAGDVSLAEMSRYPVPIMARPPLGASDLTLDSWLQTMASSAKGVKLTFTSTRTVEPAFRVLARHADKLKGPLVLSADILSRPGGGGAGAGGPLQAGGRGARQTTAQQQQHQMQHQHQQPVDAWTFLMLCRTRFPKSIISIGWCPVGAGPLAEPQPGGAELAGALDSQLQRTNGAGSPQQMHLGPSGGGGGGASAGPPGEPPMFELDLVMEHPELISGALSQHIQQLAAASRQLAIVQQARAACQQGPVAGHANGGAAAAAIGPQLGVAGCAHLLQAPGAAKLGLGRHQRHHQLLGASSTGSLNSSSGNSSGSPSPTSPVGQHMHQHHQHMHQLHQMQHMHQMHNHHQQRQSGHATDKQSQPGAWSPADSPLLARHLGGGGGGGHANSANQMPLNLNINEADPRHTTAAGRATANLAQQIQASIQQQQHLNSSQRAPFGHHQELAGVPDHQANAAKLIFNNNSAGGGGGGSGACWPHVSKKPALGHQLVSAAASRPPCSSSPSAGGPHSNQGARLAPTTNLLCVRPTAATDNQQQQQQQQHNQAAAGYTRDMIDKMASLVKEYNLTQAVTFAVEAKLVCAGGATSSLAAASSLDQLQRLLYQVGANSTLTVVAQPEDLIQADELLAVRRQFAANQILFDLPEELSNSLRRRESELLGGGGCGIAIGR